MIRAQAPGLLLSVALSLSCGAADESTPRTASAPSVDAAAADASTYRKPYRFTSDWFSPAIPLWKEALAPYVGRPELRYLEVGVFQGRSLLWVLEHVATHPSSRLVGIDLSASYSAENVELSGAADRIEMLEGRSQSVLRTLPGDSFDIIYVDGSHRGDDVLVDAVLAWPLLKEGGTLIFDDYLWHTGQAAGDSLVLPAELRPKEAIDAFVTLFRDQLTIVARSHQLILRREKPACAPGRDRRFCSRVGSYVYDWEERRALDPRTGDALDLSPGELDALERILRAMPLGEASLSASSTPRGDPVASGLLEKLGLP